jgi:hypothetical protein
MRTPGHHAPRALAAPALCSASASKNFASHIIDDVRRATSGQYAQFDRRNVPDIHAAFTIDPISSCASASASASADRRISKLLLLSYVKFGQVVARKIAPPRKRSVRCGLFQCK